MMTVRISLFIEYRKIFKLGLSDMDTRKFLLFFKPCFIFFFIYPISLFLVYTFLNLK